LELLAAHAEKLKNLTQEARKDPSQTERVLSDVDHIASVLASIATLAT